MRLNCPTLFTEASCATYSTVPGMPLPAKKDAGLNRSCGRGAVVQEVSGPQIMACCVSGHY